MRRGTDAGYDERYGNRGYVLLHGVVNVTEQGERTQYCQ